MERIEFYTSKKKSLLLLIGCILFVIGGVWLILNAEDVKLYHRYSNPIIAFSAGVASLLFFGYAMIVSIKKVVQNKIVFTLDHLGLHLNNTNSKTDLIKWDMITHFEEVSIHNTTIMIIRVKNPEFWIEKETSVMRKKMLIYNNDVFKSPFSLSAASLTISHHELKNKLNIYFNFYKPNVDKIS
ncbi:hypothetical protein SCB49_11854 [unidentified eubacterium SCB49]|nr:hypothetical protein SCB49_11854 [unidentified eubacterium SCB49]